MLGLQEITANVKELFFQKTHHPYVHTIISKPSFKEEHTYILAACMLSSDDNVNRVEKRLLATMLVQAALETHDLVAYDGSQPLSDKQLTVLAGDYYSGLYYQILSEENDISFIRLLAEGIQDVNEYKIRFYQMNYNDVDDLIEDIKMIEASLAYKICDYINASSWKHWVSNILLFMRLLEEKRKWLQSQSSSVIEAFRKLLLPHDQDRFTLGQEQYVIDSFNRILGSVQQLVETGMSQLPEISDEMQDRVNFILRSHKDPSILIVEEG